jgi:hypothetical protein
MTNDQPTTDAPLTRRALEAKIVARAWTDDAFRRDFVDDPKGQFEKYLGIRFPETFHIAVHEEAADSLHFVIPRKPGPDLAELSDEELEKVAGGTDVVVFYTIIASVIFTAFSVATAAGAAKAAGAEWD